MTPNAVGVSAREMSLQDIKLMNDQAVLDKVVDQITGGRSESDRAQIPGFSEVEVNAAQKRIVLHWKGDVPGSVKKVLANLPQGVSVQIVPAKYSKAELHAARDKLLAANTSGGGKQRALASNVTSTATRITSIAPAVDGSGLDVTYDEDRGTGQRDTRDPLVPTVRQNKTREVKSIADAVAGVDTHVSYQPLSVDAQKTRQYDTPSWYGGAGLRTPHTGQYYGICSTGFGVTRQDGKKLITTAYHCGQGTFTTFGGNLFVGSTSTQNESSTDDISGLDPGSNSSGNRIYDGSGPDDPSGFAKVVSGWGNNNVGDQVCTSGANSGIHCGIYIQQTDIGVTGENGIYRPDVDFAVSNSVAVANGDSGGPVFTGANGWTTDQARGEITALDYTTDCAGTVTADAWERPAWCLRGVYYVPIGKILSDMKWTLNTG
ncbi:S1 family peptidase [Kitasatospora sp. RB6PN24]|uniref:S1 family peptidase n=1 Tax=Kitasatospora humi TaxID=2893891 RepID=UPI001E603125|nr:S1 family peptidase [Kitasatospora humi]MCC9308815.1 S1 family peptidase [Kitasatospora humi]